MPGGELAELSTSFAAAYEILRSNAVRDCVACGHERGSDVHWTSLARASQCAGSASADDFVVGRSLAGAAARRRPRAATDSDGAGGGIGTEFFDELFGTEERRAGL